jgi:arylsulfatase A-like enzyme
MNKNYKVKLIWALLGVVFAGLLFSACSRTSDYNVLLITLDTTRADHLRCYGYKNVETPALNSLSREGVFFGRAYAPTPLTLPAHTSIFSGTLPLYHGVIDDGGYIVPDKLTLLPEVLRRMDGPPLVL